MFRGLIFNLSVCNVVQIQIKAWIQRYALFWHEVINIPKHTNSFIISESDWGGDLRWSTAVFWYILLSFLSSSTTPSNSSSVDGLLGLEKVIFSVACLFFKFLNFQNITNVTHGKQNKTSQVTTICAVAHLVHSFQPSREADVVFGIGGGHLQGMAEFRGLQGDISSQGRSPQWAQWAGGLHTSLPHHTPSFCLGRGGGRVGQIISM